MFYTGIEPYFRLIEEGELGFLEYTGDEVKPHIIQCLGRRGTFPVRHRSTCPSNPGNVLFRVANISCSRSSIGSRSPERQGPVSRRVRP